MQEITANVLLAAGASPAMVVAEEEAGFFAGIAGGVLINIGTPYPSRLRAMHASADAARAAGRPWVLDPVAAGGIPWRDGIIREFVECEYHDRWVNHCKENLLDMFGTFVSDYEAGQLFCNMIMEQVEQYENNESQTKKNHEKE